MASEYSFMGKAALEEIYPYHSASNSGITLMEYVGIKPISSTPDFRSIDEIARDEGYSPRHVKKLLNSDRVRGVESDGLWLVHPVAFAQYRVSIGKSAVR